MKKIAIAGLLLVGWAGSALADGFSFLNVGIDYLNQQRYADAVTWLDKAIAAAGLTPDQMHLAYLDRGRAHVQLNQLQEAAADFTQALAIRPNDLGAQLERSFVYAGAGQADKAADDIAASQISSSKAPSVIFYRGLVNWELGRYQAAAEAFSPLADKGYVDGWLWLQLANIKQNKPVTKYAGMSLDNGRIYRPGIPYFWPGPAMSFYAGSKKEDDVLESMEDYYASQVTECQGNFYLGEWRLVHGDAGGAKPLFQKALSACQVNNTEWRMSSFELKKL